MTQPTRPPIAKLVPDLAPFTPEQRTWLNGFFAGFLELGGAGITALSPEANAVLMSGLMPAAKGPLGPAPASRRSARSCTSAWRPRLPGAIGCSSAISGVITISSTKTS
jgi:hypothetical protein